MHQVYDIPLFVHRNMNILLPCYIWLVHVSFDLYHKNDFSRKYNLRRRRKKTNSKFINDRLSYQQDIVVDKRNSIHVHHLSPNMNSNTKLDILHRSFQSHICWIRIHIPLAISYVSVEYHDRLMHKHEQISNANNMNHENYS